MASAKTIVNACNDLTDIMEAIKRRATLAEHQARGANRQANRLGTNITGGRGQDATVYSDATGDAAMNALATLERVQSSLMDLKHEAYRVAAELAEWAPNRPADGGIRRCGADDCAREHKARGLCDAHYRAELRREDRLRAIDERRAG